MRFSTRPPWPEAFPAQGDATGGTTHGGDPMPGRHIAAVGLFGRPTFLRERLQDAVAGACRRDLLPAACGRHACPVEAYGEVGALLARLDALVEGGDAHLAGLLVSAGPEGLELRLLVGGRRRSITVGLRRDGLAAPCVARASADG